MIYIIKNAYIANYILAQKASSITSNPQLSEYERKDAKLITEIMGREILVWNGSKNWEKVSHEGTKKKMKEIDYDPKREFSGVDNYIKKARYSKKTVEEWLGK